MTRQDKIVHAIGASLVAGSVALSALTAPKPKPPPLLGAVLPGVTREMVCDHGYAQRVRHVTDGQKSRIFAAAGIPKTARVLYEIDHQVPLSVGGSNEDANLSPQPWDGPDGAHRKDLVENRAYLEVCAGRLTIAAAQSIFRTPGGWQAAVTKYGLDRPHLRAEPEHDEEGFPR